MKRQERMIRWASKLHTKHRAVHPRHLASFLYMCWTPPFPFNLYFADVVKYFLFHLFLLSCHVFVYFFHWASFHDDVVFLDKVRVPIKNPADGSRNYHCLINSSSTWSYLIIACCASREIVPFIGDLDSFSPFLKCSYAPRSLHLNF